MLTRFFLSFLFATALAVPAFEWNLPGEAWTRIDPPGVWSFSAAPRQGSLAEWRPLVQKDFNPAANRLMFSEDDGNVWSQPSVRLMNFAVPGGQVLEMMTGPAADPVIMFHCDFAGELEYELTVTDPAAADSPGADSNAIFRIGRIAEGTEEVFETFSFRGRTDEIHRKKLTVKSGDRIFFRKTVSLADDFGRRSCRVAIRIRAAIVPDASGWSAFLIPAGRTLLEEGVPVEKNAKGVFAGGKTLPYVSVDGEYAIEARAEKNASSSNGCGDVVLCWSVPENGTYRISLEAWNAGLDVKGGDGGSVALFFLPPESRVFGSPLFSLRLSPSRREAVPPVKGDTVLKLQAGEQIALRFHAGLDGYADLFRAKLTIAPGEDGIRPAAPAPEGVLPDLSIRNGEGTPVPSRPGMFWLGTSGDWLAGPHAVQSLELIRKFIPELAVIGVGHRPDLLPANPWLKENGVPSLVQSFGNGYESYWRIKGAFEWDHNGICHAEKNAVALSGMAHAAAIPHPAVKEAFDRLTRSSIRNGYTGYGFNDMVWHWGPGRGASGYNPETVRAFVQSLKGEDEGFLLGWGGEKPKRFFFRDYVKYYLGYEPRPEFIGLSSWDAYHPLWKREQDEKRKKGEDITAELMLFDMLVHYEWLKAADRIGRAAREEGGIFQVLPNPEDLANGCDFLFLAGLANVDLKTEEYFQSPLVLNGLYHRFPYFRERTAKGTETGVVLEGGGGGNGVPYYTAETSLKMAYEATLAARSDHLEADFWPSHGMPLTETVKMESVRNRYGAMLAYGLGFKYGKEDATIRRSAPEFVSITSRRIFRPWGAAYLPWNWWLNTEYSPDQLLARMGYSFAGQGEEALQEADFRADTVFFSANPSTKAGWERFMVHLESGRIRNGIVMAEALQAMIGDQMRPAPFTLPEFKPEMVADGKTLVGSRKVGKGTLYCLYLTPVPKKIGVPAENEEAGRRVYRELLGKLKIHPAWESSDPVEARLYRDGETLLVSAMRYDVLLKRQDGLYPTTAGNEASLRVKLAPGKRYALITFPELRRETVTADTTGSVKLSLGKSAYELMFLTPEERGDERYTKLKTRSIEFRRAMTLDGLAEKPAI